MDTAQDARKRLSLSNVMARDCIGFVGVDKAASNESLPLPD